MARGLGVEGDANRRFCIENSYRNVNEVFWHRVKSLVVLPEENAHKNEENKQKIHLLLEETKEGRNDLYHCTICALSVIISSFLI